MARKPRVEFEGRRSLVYLAREWGKMTIKDLGKRIGRDPSMVSRLCDESEERRDLKREGRLAAALTNRVQTQA